MKTERQLRRGSARYFDFAAVMGMAAIAGNRRMGVKPRRMAAALAASGLRLRAK